VVATGSRQAPEHSRAGRNLPAAIAVAAALVALIIVSLSLYKPAFLAVVSAAMLVALWELGRALATRGIRVPALPLAVGAVAMVFGAYVGGADVLVVLLAATILLIIVWRMKQGQQGFVADVTAAIFAAMYLPFLASFVSLLLAPVDGVQRVITFFAVVVASDTGGYAAGVLAGRHQLARSVSPKKTWEGFAGSVVASSVAGALCVTLMFSGEWWVGVVLGVISACTATVGDLAESLLKRDLGVKDMSNLLPGHGGLMDRLDSLLASVPVVWLVLHFLLPAV
jgi:phosphatidate cytidylyltransferase